MYAIRSYYANFIADKVTAPLFPDFNQELLFLMAHYADAYSVDRTEGANPITQPLDNLQDAGTLYGSIIYHKAPVVMGMLEDRIGKENRITSYNVCYTKLLRFSENMGSPEGCT